MNNELTIDKSWLKRNRNWFLPTFIVLFLLLIGLILSSNIQGNVSDIVQAYTDNSLYEKSIEKSIIIIFTIKMNKKSKGIYYI